MSGRLHRICWLGLAIGLGGCANKTTAWLPDQRIIPVLDNQALAPDCRQLEDASPFRDGPLQLDRRPSMAFGCASYGDLARMLANPRDLTHPAPYAGQDAVTAGAALTRYHDNKVTPLQGGTTTGSVAGSTGGSQ